MLGKQCIQVVVKEHDNRVSGGWQARPDIDIAARPVIRMVLECALKAFSDGQCWRKEGRHR
jgi:hypothetical protein